MRVMKAGALYFAARERASCRTLWVVPRLKALVHKVVSPENLLSESETYAKLILANSQRALRSAKETLMDIIGRTLDDALRIETLNSYSCLGDFGEARARLQTAGFLK